MAMPGRVADRRGGGGGGGGGGGPQSDEPPKVGSIHDAVVERIQPYGVFVRLAGFRKFGLVHSRQVRPLSAPLRLLHACVELPGRILQMSLMLEPQPCCPVGRDVSQRSRSLPSTREDAQA